MFVRKAHSIVFLGNLGRSFRGEIAVGAHLANDEYNALPRFA
jgi:hypothetical protein